MECILLAAGYATRLYPLTENRPKALLPVGDCTILDHIFRKLEEVQSLDEVFIVTNARFFAQFEGWAARQRTGKKVQVINDGTTNNDNRLGAIADLEFAIRAGMIEDDVLVLAGDNLFDFSLKDFTQYFYRVGENCITMHPLSDRDALRRTGVVEVDENMRVTSFEEKPSDPKSNLAVPPFYIYKRDSLPLIAQYLDGGNNPDAPGNFIPWLIQRKQVYGYRFSGSRYDIGTPDSYKRACEVFRK